MKGYRSIVNGELQLDDRRTWMKCCLSKRVSRSLTVSTFVLIQGILLK